MPPKRLPRPHLSSVDVVGGRDTLSRPHLGSVDVIGELSRPHLTKGVDVIASLSRPHFQSVDVIGYHVHTPLCVDVK